jgi:heptosyltransferase III
MKILLIKYRNIGDTLLSSALINNLKLHYPSSEIDFALNEGCEEMISNNPQVNRIIIHKRKYIQDLSIFKRLNYEIKNIYMLRQNHYDLLINLTEGERGAVIALFSGAKTKLGFRVRKGILSKLQIFDLIGDDVTSQHSVKKDLQFIQLLGKKIINKEISIFWSQDIEKRIDQIIEKNKLKDYVHIHPVSRWMFKCWEDDRMAKVIDFLSIKKNYKVVITGSKAKHEKARIKSILNLCESNPINLTGQLSLKELAYLSSKSKFFFGIDSAPMHIASATNTSVVSIFGASEATKWGAWANEGNNDYINKGIQKNSSHLIFAEDDHSIYYLNGVKKCKGMINIGLKTVIEVLDERY